MSRKKITAIGEVLIDWACLDKTLDLFEATQFYKAPGGAPANVAVGLAKLNYPVQFIGGIATDLFGTWLKEFLTSYNVDIANCIDVENANTRSAYVFKDKSGNRVFKGFSKVANADCEIQVEHINKEAIEASPLICFGSFIQSKKNSKDALDYIIDIARTTAVKVYDPNIRLCLWEDMDAVVSVLKETLAKVEVAKLSDDEIDKITGIESIPAAAAQIMAEFPNIKLLVVTLGGEGSYFINKQGSGFVKPFKVKLVEATGAGDGFVAGLLSGLYDVLSANTATYPEMIEAIDTLTADQLVKILTKANAIGAITTTKPGAMPALPTKDELDYFLTANV